MDYSLADFKAYVNNSIICEASDRLPQLIDEIQAEITQSQQQLPKIILAEHEPIRFLAGFIAAYTAGYPLFLCNPDWGTHEWQQALNLIQPDIILANNTVITHSPISNYQLPITHPIMIPTGGTSGSIKFAIHTWETLTASVNGFRQYFQQEYVNSYCVLPLYHVSGLMQFMRSFTSGGKLVIQNFKQLEFSRYNVDVQDYFISLVPTQLQRLLKKPKLSTWLSQFQTVLLGGAPAWAEVLTAARNHNIRLAPTYGMTETASQIATLKPEDFLRGEVNCGQVLPHAQVKISHQGVSSSNQIGNITVQAQSLALGYYPQLFKHPAIELDDLGFFDDQGYLNIIGRDSDKIITGGENVYPVEVEAAIRNTQLITDVCIIGVFDSNWGQAVTAFYVPNSDTSIPVIQSILKDKLSKFKLPKHWISVEALPRNAQGKVNRQHLQNLATVLLEKSNTVVSEG